MRVGIGALVSVLGGPATYARELIAALARLGGHEYVVFTDQPGAFAGLGVTSVHVPLRTAYHQATWDHWALPTLIAERGVQLYHGTKNVLPWRLSVPGVVTVHDLAVYACPDTFALPQRWHLKALIPRSVARSVRVVTDSEHARRDVMARFGVAAERTVAVPLGVGAAYRSAVPADAVASLRRRHALGERIVACVGTVQPRKHIERVIEAFVRAGAADQGWTLAIAGRIRPHHTPSWLGALPAGARFLGPLPDDDLRALYAASAIAMSASEYEGFGLTLLEAMASGCAVVAVDNTSIPEVVGDAGVMVGASDAGLLASALQALLGDPERRAALSRAAQRRAAGFTWEETARRMRAVYEEALACA
jgi:glycosyltransferase involved in cell wall biosynthesis